MSSLDPTLSELFLAFWRLDNPNVVWVLLGSVLLGASASVIGSFTFLRRRALMGDALAHAALPGVMSAFLLFQTRDPFVMLLGAVTSSFLGYYLIEYLTQHTKIRQDSALAIVLSFFFALGIFQLSLIQQMEIEGKSGLDKILFGQSAAMMPEDIQVLAISAVFILVLVYLSFYKFRLITLDRQYAQTLGVNVKAYDLVLALAIVLSVVIGLQMVGVVLMAAVLLIPVSAARYWSHDLRKILFLCAIFGALAGILSTNISYMAPKMPTGPWMVTVLAGIFLVSLVFAPARGLLPRYLMHRAQAQRVNDENVIRSLYVLGERKNDPKALFEPSSILTVRNMSKEALFKSFKRLIKANDVENRGGTYRLTPNGYEKGAKLTRHHRLWEMYLTEKVNIAPDHVHRDAEKVEHIMTDEMGERLAEELGNPLTDPHGKNIPGGQH